MTQFESLSKIDDNKNERLEETELQVLIDAVDTETEAQLLLLELEVTGSLESLKNDFTFSLQKKIFAGEKNAWGLFKQLTAIDTGTPSPFLKTIQDALDKEVNRIEGFSSVCTILQLNSIARTEYGIKLLLNEVNLSKYASFFTEIGFLQKQFSNKEELKSTQQLIQVEGIIALGHIANGEQINADDILQKYRILFARKQSLYYTRDRNKTHYESVENKSVQLQQLYTQLEEVKKEMSEVAKSRPGALSEALSRGVVPLLGPVLQGYKVERNVVDAKTKNLLIRHDQIVQSIKDIESSIYQNEQQEIKKNNLIGILYQFRAIAESNKNSIYPNSYDNLTDRDNTLFLIRTDPGLRYLNSMYESMGMDFIRMLNTNADQVLDIKDELTTEEILYNENLKNGIKLFVSFHAHGVTNSKDDIVPYADTELGVPQKIKNTMGIPTNEYDIIQAIQSGEVQIINEDIRAGTSYGTISTNREHLAYLQELTGEQYIQKSLEEISSGRMPLIYIKQQIDSAGNTTLSYSVQSGFDSISPENMSYTTITSEKVAESNGYLIGLDKTLTEYGNFALRDKLGLLETTMNQVSPLFNILATLNQGKGPETSKLLQEKVREVAGKVNFSDTLKICETLRNEGVPYLKEIQKVFDARKGAILTPAEKAFQKKLNDLLTVCENALQTYESLYDLLRYPENIQPNDLKNWFINNGIPMLMAIGAAVIAITVTVTTLGIGSGVGGMILTAGIGTAAGMMGNEFGCYASTKIGQSIYGDTYGNYTMLQKWGLQTFRGEETNYNLTQLAKQYGMDFAQGFAVTLLTLGLARGVVSSIEQQALQPGVLGNGARRLVNLLRSDQELFTQAGHSSFMKKFGKEYLEELGEEGVGESAKRIDSRLGFVAEVLINSKIQPNFIVDGKSASIQSTDVPNGKKVTIQCDGETFLENGEKHYLDLGYVKSNAKNGPLTFTRSVTNKKGETYTHTIELIPSSDPYIVREINAVINPAHGYVIKMGEKGEYTVEDRFHTGNAIARHLSAIITLANQKGMIVSDLGNGDISIRFGNQEVVIKNSQEALEKARIEKIKQSKSKHSPEQYFSSIRSRPNKGMILTETNNTGIQQQVTWEWGITTDNRGMRYATVLLQSASIDGSGGGLDTCYFSSFSSIIQNRIRQQIINQINTNSSEDLYIFIKDASLVGTLPIYNIPLTSTEQAVENQFRHIIGRRQALTICDEYSKREHKQIILEQFGFSSNQQEFLKTQQRFYNPQAEIQTNEETEQEIGQSSYEIAQELDQAEVHESEKGLLGGAASVWENMTNDSQRTATAMSIVNSIVPGSYTLEQTQAIGQCVQEAHLTANNEVERNEDGSVNYLYDSGNMSIPNRTLGGLRKKLDILKKGLSELGIFTDREVSEIAKKLMRSGVCGRESSVAQAEKINFDTDLLRKVSSCSDYYELIDLFEEYADEDRNILEYRYKEDGVRKTQYVFCTIKWINNTPMIEFFIQDGRGQPFPLNSSIRNNINGNNMSENTIAFKNTVSLLIAKKQLLFYKERQEISGDPINTLKIKAINLLIMQYQKRFFAEPNPVKRQSILNQLIEQIKVTGVFIPSTLTVNSIFPLTKRDQDIITTRKQNEPGYEYPYMRGITHDTANYNDVFGLLRGDVHDLFVPTDMFDVSVFYSMYLNSREAVYGFKQKINPFVIDGQTLDAKKLDNGNNNTIVTNAIKSIKAKRGNHEFNRMSLVNNKELLVAERQITVNRNANMEKIAATEIDGSHPKASKLVGDKNNFGVANGGQKTISIFFIPITTEDFFTDGDVKLGGGRETLYFFPKDNTQWETYIDGDNIYVYKI